jgi:hypothetical protein
LVRRFPETQEANIIKNTTYYILSTKKIKARASDQKADKTIQRWKYVELGEFVTGTTGFLLLIAGSLLFLFGLLVSPSEEYSNVINAHRLHIKQTLYYFSGVCFIMSILQYGIKMILVALADLNQNIKDINKNI